MSHGLGPAQVARQSHEIDRLNAKMTGFTILKGTRSIFSRTAAWTCRIQPRAVGRCRRLGASFFDLPREAQTSRIVRAMQNRCVSERRQTGGPL